jgi:hypothetical protein
MMNSLPCLDSSKGELMKDWISSNAEYRGFKINEVMDLDLWDRVSECKKEEYYRRV